MSKKTENIKKSLDELKNLKEEISIIIKMAKLPENDSDNSGFTENSEKISGLNNTSNSKAERIHHLENVEFKMGQQLEQLKFWFDSLYGGNGKSKSHAKQNASKENGKKGGRPPKEITEARRRLAVLEEQLIPELESQKNSAVDFDEENRILIEIENSKNEAEALKEKLNSWKK